MLGGIRLQFACDRFARAAHELKMSPFAKVLLLIRRLVVLGMRDMRDVQEVLGIALHRAGQIENSELDVRKIPEVAIEGLLPGKEVRVTSQFFFDVPASISLLEAYSLALLMKRVGAKRVFEFGTYKGVSTTQLALNLPSDGEVHTLDLPDDGPALGLEISKDYEREIAAEGGKGSLIPEELLSRVVFIKNDSARFDPGPIEGTFDLVFVDGAHSSDYVRNDSEKGWRLLRPGGVLVWHDFAPNHPEVVRYILTCGFDPQRVHGTALAFAIKP